MIRKLSILILAGGLLASAHGGTEIYNAEFKGVTKLDIDVGSADVKLVGTTDDVTSVKVLSTYREETYTPDVSRDGTSLSITGKFHLTRFRTGGRHDGDIVWLISVPRNVSIDCSSSSGEVDMENLEGDFDIHTASGDVEGQGITGDLNIKTASGDIELDALDGKADFRTASGDIQIRRSTLKLESRSASGDMGIFDFTGEIDANSASGDIEIRTTGPGGGLKFKTASGDIDLDLKGELGMNITAGTASGNITLMAEKNHLKGTFEVTALNRPGKIDTPFAFDSEKTFTRFYSKREFVTRYATIDGGNGHKKLETHSGRIRIISR